MSLDKEHTPGTSDKPQKEVEQQVSNDSRSPVERSSEDVAANNAEQQQIMNDASGTNENPNNQTSSLLMGGGRHKRFTKKRFTKKRFRKKMKGGMKTKRKTNKQKYVIKVNKVKQIRLTANSSSQAALKAFKLLRDKYGIRKKKLSVLNVATNRRYKYSLTKNPMYKSLEVIRC